MKSEKTDFEVKGVPVVFCALFHGRAVSVFPARGGKDIGETMSYNHEKAEMAFREEWQKTVRMMLDAGMPKKKIRRFYEFERKQFNSNRRFYEKTVTEAEIRTDGNGAHYSDEYFSDPESWKENIEDKGLFIAVNQLTEKQKELVTQIYVKDFDAGDICIVKGISQQAVHKMKNAAISKIKAKIE